MVRPEREVKVKVKVSSEATTSDTSSCKYKGVRKRKWGKYVSEIRLPNCRERIWLGSYDSAEKAARAFDAALFCLRGPSAKFNFPDCPPEIPGGQSLTSSQIQTVAAEYARNGIGNSSSSSSRLCRSPSTSTSSSFSDMHVDSPSLCVSNEVAQLGMETNLNASFVDYFSSMGTEYNVTGSYMYPGFDDFSNDFYVPPPVVDDYPEEQYHNGYSHDSLWNF